MQKLESQRIFEFYVGALSDDERLFMEQRMLGDPEVLLDYFDLKRDLEMACTLPHAPSPRLYQKLAQNFKQASTPQKWFFLGVPAFMVALVLVLWVGVSADTASPFPVQKNSKQNIIFDSSLEHPGPSGVL